MKPRNKLAIVTVHNGAGFDLNKTLKSIDDQINKPDLSLVVAKQLNNFHKDIYKKNYRDFIVGRDKSLWHAMNIALEKTRKYFVLFLNSGDTLYDKNSITNIYKNIRVRPITYIFKTQLVYKKTIFKPKKYLFKSNIYSPHPSFVRSPIKGKKLNKYNQKNYINADGEWMLKERKRGAYKKINTIISKHYLGGQSTNPTLKSINKLFVDNPIAGFKEIIKLFLNFVLNKKNYYKLIYFLKYEIKDEK